MKDKKTIGTEDVFVTHTDKEGNIYYIVIDGDKISASPNIFGATIYSLGKGKQKARELKKQFSGNKFSTVTAWPLIKEEQDKIKIESQNTNNHER